MDVHLLIYDLSRGMARDMSRSLLGFQLDAVYHTSIMLNGLEYVYDGSILAIPPGSSHLGRPMQQLHLGKTHVPQDVIEEYLDSLRDVYTVAAYNLWHHNCNNFSNDFATFLVGKGIPDYIINMPQAVLGTPLGAMLLPALSQSVDANRQNGGILGLQADAQRNTAKPAPRKPHEGHVRTANNLAELDALLASARKSCAVVFFTSATCAPCRTLYPLYDELAGEAGSRGILIKVDTSRAFDVAARYSISATPTFVTMLRGEHENRWSGADPGALRGNVQLLLQMAWPRHPHQSLNLPTFSRENVEPILFTKVPPMPKLLAKMGPAANDRAIKGVADFIQTRAEKGPAEAHLPDMAAFTEFLRGSFQSLPREVVFTVVDLLRCALVDPRFSGYLAEEEDHQTLVSLLHYVNGLAACPYALRLVTLQMACNLFSSPLYPDQILKHDKLRAPIIQLLSSSFLDDSHSNVRVAAASLLFNVAVANSSRRRERSDDVLPANDELELAASALEAITQEETSPEALEGMLLALGYLVYCAPLDGELADLMRTMDAADTILGKKKGFAGVKLVDEVGAELLGRGLRSA